MSWIIFNRSAIDMFSHRVLHIAQALDFHFIQRSRARLLRKKLSKSIWFYVSWSLNLPLTSCEFISDVSMDTIAVLLKWQIGVSILLAIENRLSRFIDLVSLLLKIKYCDK